MVLTVVLLVELEIAVSLFVNELLVPDNHLDDAVSASEGVWICHLSHRLAPLRRNGAVHMNQPSLSTAQCF